MANAGKGSGAAGGGLAGTLVRAVAASLGAIALGLAIVTPLELRHQALVGAATFAAALVLSRIAGRAAVLAMIALSAAVSTRYLWWRISMTLPTGWSADAICGALLLLAELYAWAMLLLGYFQSLHPLDRKPVPLPEDPRRWPTVDVFVPTYDEPLSVVRATVLAAKALDWPADKLHVYLLDDGKRDAFRAFAAQAGVGYLVRPDNRHAKAGNLNHALARTRGELVAVFDCDHVPTRSFLQATVGWFLRDRKLAMVQTPHHFYTPDPFERNLRTFRRVPNEGELFYGLIQPTNDLWNAAFFCGSAAVLRRTAVESIGGVATETVTEDAHTALKLHRRGYHTAYLAVPQSAGLATESLAAHVRQRIRWARGMAQIFRIDNPLLGGGLRLPQRLCYLASMMHFLYGLPRLAFLVAPIGYLAFDLHILNAVPIAVLAHWLPHVLHAQITNSRVQGRFRHSFWSEVYETCLAAYIALPTTFALLRPHGAPFTVTPKGGRTERLFFDWRTALPYAALCLVNLVALGFGIHRFAAGGSAHGVTWVNLAWAIYNLVILGATAAVAWETRQVRARHRVPVELPAMLRLHDDRTVRCTTRDLSLGGANLLTGGERVFAAGDRMHLSILLAGGDEVPVPVEVVHHDGAQLRLRFSSLGIEEESHLVRAIFSRADAWIGWRAPGVDRPLRSFLTICGKALAAAVRPFVGRGVPGGAA